MHAHLILTTILFGELRFTDTQCLTSGNLADLMLTDAVTDELLRSGICQVALRDEAFGGGRFDGLQALSGTFGSNAFVPEYAEIFNKCAEKIEKIGTFVRWNMKDVSSYYTKNTFRLLNTELSRIGRNETELQISLSDFLAKKIEDNGGFLKRDFIRFCAPSAMSALGHHISGEFIELLEMVSSAYYVSAVPTAVGSSTIYESSQKNILALRDGVNFNLDLQSTTHNAPSPVDLRFLIEGLCILDIDDVLSLIYCQEAVAYRQALSVCQRESSGISISDVRTRLFELQQKIDETILERDGRFKTEPTSNNIRQARTLIDYATGAITLAVSVVTVLSNIPLPGLGMIIGLPAKGYRNRHFGDARFAASLAAQHRERTQGYSDRMRKIGKGEEIQFIVPVDAKNVAVEAQLPSFVAV